MDDRGIHQEIADDGGGKAPFGGPAVDTRAQQRKHQTPASDTAGLAGDRTAVLAGPAVVVADGVEQR